MDIAPPLESKIKGLADDPGVYLMKDAAGGVIYVGKAKNLRNRVSCYFQDQKDRHPRIELLVRRIADFEVVITDTEVEALILECNLIKKYKPRFNVRLKDDKGYPYVRIDVDHPFPRVELVWRTRKDGARYFGPFVSSYQIKDVLKWLGKTFQLRTCSDNEFRNRSRPCIYHQMGQCSAPCVGLISQKDYNYGVEQVLRILQGKSDEVVRELKAAMAKAAEEEHFEKAAEIRDRISKIEEITQDQKITDPEAEFDRDIVHFARGLQGGATPGDAGAGDTIAAGISPSQAVVVVMSVRQGKVVGVFQFPFEDVDPMMPDEEFLFGFLAQYYVTRYEENPGVLAPEVLLPPLDENTDLKHEAGLLSLALGRRVDFRIPKRGEAADLVAMVKKTAEFHLAELSSRVSHATEDLLDVQRRLNLTKFPRRIECYDISHFQGEGTVASRVVFVDGKPEKQLYRHYHVREAEGEPDDFASMREILERRFSHDASIPDLVVVDGGKGQLAQAELIFRELQVSGVELVSIAKARTERDFQAEEVSATMERIFKPNQKNFIALKPGTGAHRVLTQARDESHRFAITFHRKTRDKRRKGR